MGKVYLNGQIVDRDAARISAADSGYLHGVGLFETMRAVGGRVFALGAHLDRLLASAEALHISHGFSRETLVEAIERTIRANELADARVRLTLSGGVQRGETSEPTLLVTATALESYPAAHYEKGVRVVLSDFRQNAQDPTTGHKTTNFLARLLALRQAHAKGAAEALWFTHKGLLAEGCISNVFIVTDGVLRTPRLETPVMPGVARRHVLQLAGELGITAKEEDLTIRDLLAAEEVFITNVIMLVLPVVAIEAHTVGSRTQATDAGQVDGHHEVGDKGPTAAGRPGPVTRRLMERLREYVVESTQGPG